MKKLIYLGMIVLSFTLFGCGKASVEDVAKDYVNKQFKQDKNANIDTSQLKYTVKKEGDDKATVTIKGKIKYEAKLFFVKKDKKWELIKEAAAQAAVEKQASGEAKEAAPVKVEEEKSAHEAAPAPELVKEHAAAHHK